MVAVPLIHGKLEPQMYNDDFAADPRIDALREKIYCVEDKRYTKEYMEADKRSIGNGVTIEFNNGFKLDEIAMDYPVGHARRRQEAIPLIAAKLEKHLDGHFDDSKKKQLLGLITDHQKLTTMPVNDFIDVSAHPDRLELDTFAHLVFSSFIPLTLALDQGVNYVSREYVHNRSMSNLS